MNEGIPVTCLKSSSYIQRTPPDGNRSSSLLQDAVDGGASLGCLAPLSDGEAPRYWTKVFVQVGDNGRIVLAAVSDGAIVGSVQLELASMPNALHRAEVQKLLVIRSWRRRGLGRSLMTAIEQVARREGCQLLVLDTRLGDAADPTSTGVAARAYA
jgi:GNAT superfamily N-acetyltransferase